MSVDDFLLETPELSLEGDITPARGEVLLRCKGEVRGLLGEDPRRWDKTERRDPKITHHIQHAVT